MPVRRRNMRRRQRAVRLADLDIGQILCLLSGLDERELVRYGWANWQAYDDSYEAVRSELLATPQAQAIIAEGGVIFAEGRRKD